MKFHLLICNTCHTKLRHRGRVRDHTSTKKHIKRCEELGVGVRDPSNFSLHQEEGDEPLDPEIDWEDYLVKAIDASFKTDSRINAKLVDLPPTPPLE